MAKINAEPDINVVVHSNHVTEISTVYDNRFIRKLYVGLTHNKAVKRFEEDLKKGKL